MIQLSAQPFEQRVPPQPGHRAALWIVLLFFAALMLVIPEAARFRGDERFYTSAAMHMVQNGDIWTPAYADGRIRLLKPILTYWAVAGSFHVLGVSLFAARLPFLLAGTLVVYFTWHLARTVFKCERTALLAACIMASDIELMNLSTRSTPDALVCLFVLLSMWGFARVWFQADKTLAGPLLAFGGMGLAAQTKGLTGIAPLAANALFWFASKPKPPQSRALLRWPALVIGLGLGLFWYVIMFRRHGLGAFQEFYADQLGGKASYHPGAFFVSLAKYLFAGFRQLLPWTLLLVAALIWSRADIASFWNRWRKECRFLLAMFAVLLVFFSFGNVWRARFLISSHPMLAVLIAGCILSMPRDSALNRKLGSIITGISIPLLLAGTGLFAAAAGPDWRLIAGGIGVVALGLWGIPAGRSTEPMTRYLWLTGAPIVAFALANASLRPVLAPSPIAQAAVLLRQINPPPAVVHTYALSDTAESQLRILLAGIPVNRIENTSSTLESDNVRTAVTVGTNGLPFARAGFELIDLTTTNLPSARSWLGQLTRGKSRVSLADTYWIALKQR